MPRLVHLRKADRDLISCVLRAEHSEGVDAGAKQGVENTSVENLSKISAKPMGNQALFYSQKYFDHMIRTARSGYAGAAAGP